MAQYPLGYPDDVQEKLWQLNSDLSLFWISIIISVYFFLVIMHTLSLDSRPLNPAPKQIRGINCVHMWDDLL